MSGQALEYHGSVTMFPDGRIFSGGHKDYPTNGGLIAKVKAIGSDFRGYGNETKALFAREKTTTPNTKLGALLAKIKQNEYNLHALSAATSIANASNLTHLQLVRLLPEAQGAPVDYFWLDNMFIVRDVAMLEYRESFRDVTATAEYRGRSEETPKVKTSYDEIKYDLPKLTDTVVTPIEDIMRTIINPQTVDMENLDWGFKHRRERAAIEALDKLGNAQAVDSFFSLSSGAFHSTNRGASQLNTLFSDFLKAEDVPIDYVAMNAKTLSDYTENTWTLKGPTDLNPIRVAGGGVIPLPGIAGITCVVSPFIDDNKIYGINKRNAMRLGQGPVIMRRFYDEDRDQEAIKKLDFNEYIAVNSQITKLTRKFGMTITVAS